MTTRELIHLAASHPMILVPAFLSPPFMAWITGRVHTRGAGGNAPWKSVYSFLVYAVCVPGMFAAVVTGYTLFFTRENLLDVSVIVYLLPLFSMIGTLVLIRKNVRFEQVPGFDRLAGLMTMLGCSFAIALAVQKTNIWIFFGGSIERLVVVAGAVFALLKWGTHALFRGRHEPRKERPPFPTA